MEKLSCGILQDLLISYNDGLTGERVTQMLQEHLEECTQCRQRYEEIKQQQAKEATEAASKGNSFMNKLKSIRYYILGIIIGLMIPIAIILLFFIIGSIMSYIEQMIYSNYL